MARWVPEAISASGYAWRVATPTFSVVAGTYNIEKSVVVAVDTADATIRYTLDGTDPTTSSSTIASGSSVTIDQSRTLKAKAWKTGMPDGAIQSAAYTLQALTPSITIPSGGPFNSPQNVSMQTSTADATIRYTLDGTSPTASSPVYSSALVVDQTTTFKSVTFKTGWSASGVQSGTITFNYGALDPPSIDPATGNYAGTVSVTMSSTQSGATIRYTTNGTTPTASSTAYAGSVPISNTTTIKAKAFHSSYSASGETSRTFTMSAATPTLSAAAGSYAPGSTVTISTTEPTATLRMTIDGTDPTSTSLIVSSGTSLILGNFTLKVKAFRSNVGDSAIASAAYSLTSALGPGAVTSGGSHNVLATPDGRVMVWGNNGNGQLGNEATADRPTPTVINTITGVTAVASGLAHTLALTSDGRLFSWGSNTNGRLGNGSTTQSTKPVHISTLSNVVAIAAGDAHSLALTGDGRVFSWGLNTNGQLGLGNSGSGTDQNAPTEITGLTNIVAIAAGDSHSFAVTSGGQVFAWGANGNSRLGDGSTTQQNSPLLLSLSNIASIAAGQAHTLALTSGGRIYGWGANGNGQLGIAPATTLATPTLIPNLHASAIFAGDNQSGAVRADGALLMWGSSSSGQVGSGSITATISTPTVISGVSGASSVSLGDLHSVAVTASGELFTWGESADYRLGNSLTTPDKSTPQSVLTGLTSWAAASPTIDVASASFTEPTIVTLTSPTSGAVIRYALNGSAPTANDPEVPANGQIEIAYSSLLRARVFVSGRAPSALPARADYELQSAAPSISPGTGTYSSAQTVTITATGAPGTIRYTLDGSDPTGSSSLYSSPLTVAGGTTIKAKTFPSNGWSASAAATATLAFNFGTLATPVATPASGAFQSAPQVTLTAAAGTIIRYTTNGTAPTASSTLYSGPISIAAAGATVKSIALHPDWSTSGVMTATYTIDTEDPAIVARPFPSAFNGWHLTPVTVSFTCSDNTGVSSCTPPATISVEGVGQTTTGTAVDTAGNDTTIVETFSLDLTPPVVTLTSPIDGLVTTSDTATVTGTAADALSGLATVMCNGVTATVVDGQVTCVVALRPGRNTISISALDVAGHSASVAVNVRRVGTTASAPTMTPNSITLIVEEEMSLSLRDTFGVTISGALWSSTDSGIVSLSADDPPVLTAVAPGTVSVSAEKDGFSASSVITVTDVEIGAGQQNWSSHQPSSANLVDKTPIYANPIDEEGPDIFTVAEDTTTREHTVWAIGAARGEAREMIAAPGKPLMGDTLGGMIAGVEASPTACAELLYYASPEQTCYKALVRFAGPVDTSSWRYESHGVLDRPAQAPDGTIYVTEHVSKSGALTRAYRSVVILDGETGTVKGRVPLANSVTTITSELLTPTGGCPKSYAEGAPFTAGPIIGSDGAAYLLASQVKDTRHYKCVETFITDATYATDIIFRLLRISSTGNVTETMLENSHRPEYWLWTDPVQLLPDGIGGVLIVADHGIAGPSRERRLTRLDAQGNRTDTTLDRETRIELIGQNGIAYIHRMAYGGSSPTSLAKDVIDVSTMQTKWTLPTGLSWLAAGADGGATAQNASLQIKRFDGTGQEVETYAQSLLKPVQDGISFIASVARGVTSYAGALPDLTVWSAIFRDVNVTHGELRFQGNTSNQNWGVPSCARGFVIWGNMGTIGVEIVDPNVRRFQWGVDITMPWVGLLRVHESWQDERFSSRRSHKGNWYTYEGVGGTTHGSRGYPADHLKVGSTYRLSARAWANLIFHITGNYACRIPDVPLF